MVVGGRAVGVQEDEVEVGADDNGICLDPSLSLFFPGKIIYSHKNQILLMSWFCYLSNRFKKFIFYLCQTEQPERWCFGSSLPSPSPEVRGACVVVIPIFLYSLFIRSVAHT